MGAPGLWVQRAGGGHEDGQRPQPGRSRHPGDVFTAPDAAKPPPRKATRSVSEGGRAPPGPNAVCSAGPPKGRGRPPPRHRRWPWDATPRGPVRHQGLQRDTRARGDRRPGGGPRHHRRRCAVEGPATGTRRGRSRGWTSSPGPAAGVAPAATAQDTTSLRMRRIAGSVMQGLSPAAQPLPLRRRSLITGGTEARKCVATHIQSCLGGIRRRLEGGQRWLEGNRRRLEGNRRRLEGNRSRLEGPTAVGG